MTLEEIRELIKLVIETGVAELELERGDNRVRIRLGFPAEAQPAAMPIYHTHAQASATSAPHAGSPDPARPAPVPAVDPSVYLVKSPIVGTFYECASPGSAPFVRVGEKVAPGKVLCIIESMKLMNEIEAEIAGIVESRLVPNGQPVEYGEALFAIRAI
jgi:acetyl-CoA carboxylase biotin carboxyl carrier protein